MIFGHGGQLTLYMRIIMDKGLTAALFLCTIHIYSICCNAEELPVEEYVTLMKTSWNEYMEFLPSLQVILSSRRGSRKIVVKIAYEGVQRTHSVLRRELPSFFWLHVNIVA